MKINGDNITLKQLTFLCLYYGFARHLPSRLLGGKQLRRWCCRHIFKHCGKNVTIEHGAHFGTGVGISLGDFACLGIDCKVPSNLTMGREVMMGPNCVILDRNHKFERTDIPIGRQGNTERMPVVIEDDVWIGCQVLIMPGRTIKKGSIIAGGCVLCQHTSEQTVSRLDSALVLESSLPNRTQTGFPLLD